MDRDRFPSDLLRDQTAWYLTYDELAHASASSQTGARRRLLELSRRIAGHSFWETPAGTPAARVARKEIARARTEAGS
ncbi:hypothetical protein [Streptomyces sp. ISL-100]|uniref:hypothetical protein n=1 Tax=Streptomyces sp. ISL-100 TaxID=2819173 RepID=UPI001BE7C19F|nr:hypothetical protein [Streptomyces sp. ISL-100]MBT2396268.1 hypothetical protein [Streptomyces sp. ISL-100]